MNTPEERLLTARDLAKKLQVGQRTIWRWVAEGRLPAPVRISSHCLRWRWEDVDRHFRRAG
jgi:excisionase family DNA binding protein